MAEEHRGRIAAVFAANAELQVAAGLTPPLAGDFDQFTDALDVKRGERIVLEDTALLLLFQE